MRTPEPDVAPKTDGHALGLRVSGEIYETQWASGATADEVLQLCAHVENAKSMSGKEMISRSRTHAPRPLLCHTISDDGGRLVHRQRLTIRVLGNANEVASEAGVVDWLKGLMKQLVVIKFATLLIRPSVTA